ncbi:MAG: hypothetical protein H0U74_04115 [Bradymonadaceae bacterium]|nr:hypothetical protein [Lujinxingiaceae bacterium]
MIEKQPKEAVLAMLRAALVCLYCTSLFCTSMAMGCSPSPDDLNQADSGWDIDEDDAIGQQDVGPYLCPLDYGEPDPACNLVTQDECGPTAYCQLILLNGEPPPVPRCTLNASAGPRALFETCDSSITEQRCDQGLLCVSWGRPDPRGMVCSNYCFMDTNEGCNQDAYCTHFFADIAGIGLCVPRCDPYDARACPDGQACVADHTFPAKTCSAEFRCMLNGASTSTKYKAACRLDRMELAGNGCADGLSCHPTSAGPACVRPCKSDTDCSSFGPDLSCKQAQGDYALRYCDF